VQLGELGASLVAGAVAGIIKKAFGGGSWKDSFDFGTDVFMHSFLGDRAYKKYKALKELWSHLSDCFVPWADKKIPNKPGTYPREDFYKLLNKIAPLDQFRLDRGCIGIVGMALDPIDVYTKIFQKAIDAPKDKQLETLINGLRPELNSDVVGPWLNANDAFALKGIIPPQPPLGPNDKYVVFSLQGPWKGGKEPIPDANGMVPKDSIDPNVFNPKSVDKNGKFGLFNYGVYLPSVGLWLDANNANEPNSKLPNGKPFPPQEFRLQKSNEKGNMPNFQHPSEGELKGTIYFARIYRG
jgi:hypothetical protein